MLALRSAVVWCCGVSAFVATVGCSSSSTEKSSSPVTEEKYLGLSTPEDGFQVRSLGMPIEPGDDIEYCEVAEIPGDPGETYYVSSIEFANGPSSHHLIIDAAKDGGAAEAKLADMKIGDRVECLSSQSRFGDGFEFVGGTQTRYQKTDYPEGVGRIFHGGQRFVFDYHYLNTSEDVVQAKSAVNFHLTSKNKVEKIAQIFNFNNVTIDTPPGKSGSFTGECRLNQDVRLSELTRHTHRWGTDYTVWYAGGEHDGEQIFTTPNYEHDVDHYFGDAILVKKGEGFRFQCNYQNTETHALRFGPNATDEMCILFGVWWTANDGEDPVSQDCSMTQIGDDGIARAVSGPDGFRKPTASEVSECLSASSSNPSQTAECVACTCNACGGLLADCQADEDCSAILDCIRSSGCRGMAECAGTCADAINEHSSGTGPLIQVSQCLGQSCPDCSGGAADAGK